LDCKDRSLEKESHGSVTALLTHHRITNEARLGKAADSADQGQSNSFMCMIFGHWIGQPSPGFPSGPFGANSRNAWRSLARSTTSIPFIQLPDRAWVRR
jgi:hypothetical protein